MRMWLTPPEAMCRKHLMGEHVEMHMFVGTIAKGKSLEGYYRDGLLNSGQIKERHDQLAAEMIRRGMNHESELAQPLVTPRITVDLGSARRELARRCPDCRRGLESSFGREQFADVPRGGDRLYKVSDGYGIVFNGVHQHVFCANRNKADSTIERIRREWRASQAQSL